MTPFRVLLARSVVEEASVEVYADSSREAEEMARQRAKDDMVSWTRVHGETVAEVERG